MNPSRFRLVVTAGPTREWLDPVRFLSNPSTGRMGHGVASRGAALFREVVYVHGPVAPEFSGVPARNARNVAVETTEEMARAVLGVLSPDCLLVMAAAPADFTPAFVPSSKIHKGEGGLLLELRRTTDILLEVAKRKGPGLVTAGFCAETDDLESRARAKLGAKSLDFICANRVDRDRAGFGDNPNRLLVLGRRGERAVLGPAPKDELAGELLDFLIRASGGAPEGAAQ